MLESEKETIHIDEHVEVEVEEVELEYSAPKVRSPWRRYFARIFDFSIYSIILLFIQAIFLNINIVNQKAFESLLISFFTFLLMILVEPLLLALFGTTPGKWLLGLRVTDNEGQRLTYINGLSRIVTVFWRGYGLNVPIYNIVRLWRSYSDCKAGETLDWECDSIVHLKDQKKWRIVAYIAAHAVWLAIIFLILNIATMPKNRGEITKAEFSENYNRLAEYLDIATSRELDETGQWVARETEGIEFYLGEVEPPIYNFTENNGYMTGLYFTVELKNSEDWITGYKNEIILSVLSFVRAQPGNSLTSRDVTELINQIVVSPIEDFQFTSHGVTILCDYEYSGYYGVTDYGTLFPNEDEEERFFSVEFKMYK